VCYQGEQGGGTQRWGPPSSICQQPWEPVEKTLGGIPPQGEFKDSRNSLIPGTFVQPYTQGQCFQMAHRCQQWDGGPHRNGKGCPQGMKVPSTLAKSALVSKLQTLHDPVIRHHGIKKNPPQMGPYSTSNTTCTGLEGVCLLQPGRHL